MPIGGRLLPVGHLTTRMRFGMDVRFDSEHAERLTRLIGCDGEREVTQEIFSNLASKF